MNKKWKIIATLSSILLIGILILVWQLDITNWQKLDISKITGIKLSTKIYDLSDKEIATLSGTEQRIYVDISFLPEYVPQAFIAAEDTRFYSHNGIDIRRIFGALLNNIRSGSYSQGASTITQQLIKLTHLTSEKTLARKAQEAYLALSLENEFTKDDILEAYLNTVYFGGGAYGIGAASRRYFDKEATELSLGEASLLAGIIKSPSNYAPHIDIEAAYQRQSYVLESMTREGFISREEAAAAVRPEITEAHSDNVASGWYFDAAATEAREILDISYEELLGGGYSIYTGLNPTMQTAAEYIMESDEFYPERSAQGALVAIEPASGEILALIGGRDYNAQFSLNRALAARRQPGSLIKPISTYAAAIDKYAYMPTSKVFDVQREYANGYMPGNSGSHYYGETTLRNALARSLNAATVDLAETIGVREIIKYAEVFGIPVDNSDKNLALSLGAMTYGATPIEMCAAYAALANGGEYNKPHIIRKITDRYGKTVYEYAKDKHRCVSEQTAYVITDMLQTAATTGTARSLAQVGIPIAAKTGTSGLDNGDTSDAWAAAYTSDITVTVWIGKDDNSDGGMAKSVTGGGYAAPACADFLSKCRNELAGEAFEMPVGLTKILIDGYALDNESRVLLASKNTPGRYIRSEVFKTGTMLNKSDVWEAPAPVNDLKLISKKGEAPVIEFTCISNYSEYLVIRSCRGAPELIGIEQCTAGEHIRFSDSEADISQINTYYVIPRHRLLYANGQTLLGPESIKVTAEPAGLLNGLSSLFTPEQPAPEIESLTDPLF